MNHPFVPQTRKMGDKATLAKARRELEDMYLGVPDDSVNLSFKDFASVQLAERKMPSMVAIGEEGGSRKMERADGAKSPSLDFGKALEAAKAGGGRHVRADVDQMGNNRWARGNGFRSSTYESSMALDDVSVMSGVSRVVGYQERGGRKRAGIPHTNICTICSLYIYIFRHRCLVCGRVYCRQCVSIGMGEMSEGRKCIECLGRRFSERYIKRAGNMGCCARYPGRVKQEELRWAEKGPRRSGERRGRPPMAPMTSSMVQTTVDPPSYVMSRTYSPSDHHIPF